VQKDECLAKDTRVKNSSRIRYRENRRELTSIQIARRALANIRVRRVLDNEYSSDESQASLPVNVITEREYPYNANDYSLIK